MNFGSWKLSPDIEFRNSWAQFLKGSWQRSLPKVPGTYPTATREGTRAKDRTLVERKDGTLVDTMSSLSEGGTTWQGWWWSKPYTQLPVPPDW
jgi:hypothetical protein